MSGLQRASAWSLGVFLALGAGALVAWTPTSPFGIDRANEAYLRGQTERATALYEQVASGWGTRTTRTAAAERAALLHLEAGDAKGAVRWLRTGISLARGPTLTRLQALLGFVYASKFDDHRRAGEVYEQAADAALADGRDTDASELRVDAARAFSRAEDWGAAQRAWARAIPDLTDPAGHAEAETALLRAAQRQTDVEEVDDGVTDAGTESTE